METGATFVTSMALRWRQQRVCDTPWSVPGTRTAAGADEYACESLFITITFSVFLADCARTSFFNRHHMLLL